MIDIHYAAINKCDVANGKGVRISLFVSGCKRRCKGCFNPQAWDFNYGQKFTWETVHELEELLASPHIQGLSILGGDPFEPENRLEVMAVCAYLKHKLPDKDIWVWTGFSWDDIKDLPVLKYIDVLVDGPFVESLKDLRLPYCGSSNQRVINVQEGLKAGEVVLWES